MSLSWFRVDVDMVDHPKTYALAESIGDPLAGWYLIRAWAWTMRYAAHGRLSDGAETARAGGAETALERACGWHGEPGALVAALVACGWLDRDENGALEVHDWDEKQGAAVAKADKDAERKRKFRKSRRVDGAETARGRRADGAETALSRRGYETRRDETRRDVREEKKKRSSPVGAPEPLVLTADEPKATPDARHAPLVAALVAAGASFESRNARDVTRLLALATQAVGHDGAHEEVLARWRRALGRSGYPTVRALNELATHWGHFGPPRDTTLSDWSHPEQTPDANGDVKF